ncbi:MAG: 1-acyl-sn-glycerol-3-phosphate acyltransferase [Provencibacterium sp.]|jgi:1-acyl-sn-glycerol-3-phosphate acyltransferase|nr:1-acyl-sn-glycerol-3-phosphate acyltransferase [Provencibacterium sp.]
MFYRFARSVLWLLFHLLFHVRSTGKENLPAGGGYIVASNHRTQCDPVFIGICIRPTLTFMAKIELFRIPFVGWIIRWLGAFPVERGKGDTGAVDFAKQTVRSGKVLAMFPEGTRSKDGKLQRLKSGCTVIASATNAQVVPVAIRFGEKLRFRSRVEVCFGKPISPEELGVDPAAPSTIKGGNRLIGGRIAALLEAPASQ